MPKSIDQGFDSFLSGLQPLASEHNTASSHYDSVKRCLVNKFGCTRIFETGSFGNGTGIRHYSDTDYFAVIPAANLYSNSATSLRGIKEALQATFPRTTGIVVNSPAVKIPFGIWASETLEVTPAHFTGMVEYDDKKFNNYGIPDTAGGWMNSSPSAHNYYVKIIDDKLSNQVKPLIRLMKAWKYYNTVPISSFFLELYTARYCYSEPSIIYGTDLSRLFNRLEKDELPGMYDPVGISGHLKPCASDVQHRDALSKIKTAAGRAARALTQAQEGKIDAAFETYDLLFNRNFPAR